MTLGQFLAYLGKRFPVIIGVALAVLALELAVIFLQGDTYQAAARIAVNNQNVEETRQLAAVAQTFVKKKNNNSKVFCELDVNLSDNTVKIRCTASSAKLSRKGANLYARKIQLLFKKSHPDCPTTLKKATYSRVIDRSLRNNLVLFLPVSIACALACGIAAAMLLNLRGMRDKMRGGER